MRTRGKRWRRVAAAAVIAGTVTPTVLRWLRRTGAAKRAVDLRMTVVVERPINHVFEFCRDFENFPQIVDVLLSVEDSQDGRSHWAVRSPTGQAIEWDATVTKYVPNSVIGWSSVPGSDVQASGLMRFYPLSATQTRVDISLNYLPQSTRLGEAIRALFTPSNTERLRAELNQASRQLPEPAARTAPDDEPVGTHVPAEAGEPTSTARE